jgi:isoquinoline 1-oxidoreductase alpha subunit
MITISINGADHALDIEPETPLLWVIRDELGLTGTKYGCGIAQCGACTVHIDGVATRSCSVSVGDLGKAKVTTIEGLDRKIAGPSETAWIEHDVPQCGYCQSGQIMATAALLVSKPAPSDADIASEITNICRCGTYPRVKAAIHRASDILKG